MEAIDLRRRLEELEAVFAVGGAAEKLLELDRLLDAVAETRQLQGLAEMTGGALAVQPINPIHSYLYGMSLSRLGRIEEGSKALRSLCGKLEQEEQWELLGRVVPRILDAAPSVEAARAVAKLGETLGIDAIDGEALRKAYDLYPDEERLAYLMGERAAADGNEEAALGYWAESVDGFVRLRRYDRLEEAILKIADSDRPEHQRHILNALHRLADQNQWKRFQSFLELSLPGIRKAALTSDLWKLLLHLFPKAPEEAGLRKWVRTLAPEAFPAAEGILDLLGRSGILDPQIRTETALKQLETLLEFAPGFHVLHTSWGIGRVRLNDGETIVLDFKDSANHRMKLTLARRALAVLLPDDLRVIASEDPDRLKTMLRQEPAKVIAQTLQMLRGEATTQEIRRTLVSLGIISAGSWSAWWKEARRAIVGDERVDTSQSFRQVYRLRAEGAEEDDLLSLPVIELRRGIRPNLNLIRRFLEQHPDEKGRAARTYTTILQRWAREEKTSAEDRLAVRLALQRWSTDAGEELKAALASFLETSTEMTSFPDPADQERIVQTALESADLWERGVLLALSSRSATIRELAVQRMGQDPQASAALLLELAHQPSERPLAALAVIDLSLDEGAPSFLPSPWQLAFGAVGLIETATKEPIRNQALGLLRVGGPLAQRLAGEEPPSGTSERWGAMLRRWRSSERYRKPILDLLEATGQSEIVREINTAHAERTDRILGASASAGATDYRGHIMTGATYRKLLHHRNWLVWELKTTVARTIQKARELGDLRENAEYHAAKAKQSDYAQEISGLSARLSNARLIEQLEVPAGEVGPGTSVLVEDIHTGERRSLWVLGEGDDWVGQGVISYAAPMGRAILGKRAGDRVTVVGSDSVHELLIREIERRLPQATQAEPEEEELEVTEEDLRAIAEGVGEEETPGQPGP